jgi:hypothetical protein
MTSCRMGMKVNQMVKNTIYMLGFIALLVLPTLADAIPDPLLKLAAAFGMAAYIIAVIVSFFAAIQTVIKTIKTVPRRS